MVSADGHSDVNNVSSENIVALCDVDDLRAEICRIRKAKRYRRSGDAKRKDIET
jgi:hypothetical protein